jgi:hypothetical protein
MIRRRSPALAVLVLVACLASDASAAARTARCSIDGLYRLGKW